MKHGAILLHGHHENAKGCPLSILDSAQSRVVEIETLKPEAERATRLLLLREVDASELPHAEARAAYEKAWAAYEKAWAASDKAWAARDKAWAASASCLTPAEWGEWHAEHCGAYKMGLCKWTPEHPSIF